MSTAAAEFSQLVGTIREWADAHLATDDPQCRLCPICQAIGALRESRPEVVEHLTLAAASMVAAARSFLDGMPAGPGRPGGGDGPVGAARPDGGDRPGGVEHIDVA